jgi:hypothetical protein
MRGIRPLADGYVADVDRATEESWADTLRHFDDANLFQTWAYGHARQGRSNLSHLVVRRGRELVAVAQVRLFRVPVLGGGIAYVRSGPVWATRDSLPRSETFRQAIRALRNEYVVKRSMVLRVFPGIRDEAGELRSILEEEDFASNPGTENTRTLLMHLDRGLDELRAGLAPKWRNHLNRAKRNGLEIVCGDNGQLFEDFLAIYSAMRARKRFVDPTDVRSYKDIQAALPDECKMKIFICRARGEVCAGAVVSAIGKIAMHLFSATNELGREMRAAYLVRWQIVEWLKGRGCQDYDLNGINPVGNPGVYEFKAGLCGRQNGEDVTLLGSFDACAGTVGSTAILLADRLRQTWRARAILPARDGPEARRGPVISR